MPLCHPHSKTDLDFSIRCPYMYMTCIYSYTVVDMLLYSVKFLNTYIVAMARRKFVVHVHCECVTRKL